MEEWSFKHESAIKNYLINSLKESLIDASRGVDFENFKKWLNNSKDNKVIQVGFANKIINVATNLNCLDDYGYAEGSAK